MRQLTTTLLAQYAALFGAVCVAYRLISTLSQTRLRTFTGFRFCSPRKSGVTGRSRINGSTVSERFRVEFHLRLHNHPEPEETRKMAAFRLRRSATTGVPFNLCLPPIPVSCVRKLHKRHKCDGKNRRLVEGCTVSPQLTSAHSWRTL